MKFSLLLLVLAATFEVVHSQLTLVCPDGVVLPFPGTVRDWTLRYARCYLAFSESPLTWSQALQVCQRYGGKLAEPSGFRLTQDAGTIATATDATLTQFWIGYNRRGLSSAATEGLWSDGRATIVDVGVWGAQQPDILAGDCVYMQRGAGSSWTWHMASCHLHLPFMCQATPCPDNTFRCDNGQCVGQTNVCNEYDNCGDNSDERNCAAQCSYYNKTREGSLAYPNTGISYFHSRTCQWVIEGAIGSRLQIQFLSVNTEKDLDFVEVWVGGRTLSSSTLVRRLSGSLNEEMVVSSNNAAIVRFVSDDSIQDSGFSLTWQSGFQCSMEAIQGQRAADGETASLSQPLDKSACRQQCENDVQCVAYVYDRFASRCLRYNAMPRPSSDACCTLYVKTCPGYNNLPSLRGVPGNGGHLYALEVPQRFYSPLYPAHYIGDMITSWTIHSPGSQIVTLHIIDLDLEVGDSILVFDGNNSMGRQLASMAGQEVTATGLMTADDQRIILSTKNKMLITFTSHRHSHARGFLFAYQAGCNFDLTASKGRIVTPGYQTDMYPNILHCRWNIQVPAGRSLSLAFDPVFALQDGKDFLQVTADGSQVHTGSGFTGSTPPTNILAQNGLVQLILTTGATGQAVGLRASFSAGCVTVNDATLETSYSGDYGISVVVRCASEYVFTGVHSGHNSVGVYCQEGGDWSHVPFPTCARVFCGPPPDIQHGYLVSVKGPYSGDTANYTCETGFQISSTTPITCRNSGSWDNPPFCFSTQSCPAIQDPFQGQYVVTSGNGLDHGSVVSFSCTNNLYELQGSPNLLCLNGQWSDNIPTCERIPCIVPYIANGTVSPSVNVVDGQTLRIDCKPGFTLNGSSVFSCGQTPTASCINRNECQSSACSQGCVDTVGSFYCTCNPGFALLSDQRTCADIDECSINRGGCDGFCVNTAGSYSCQCSGTAQLYTYNGQFGITLPPTETGLEPWNVYHLNHTCIQTPTVECPQPPQSISNGHLLGETGMFTVGQSVTYLCQLGFVAQGLTTLTCQASGEWSSPVPTCVEATCPVPVINFGTLLTQTPTKYLEYVSVSCDLLGVRSRQLTSRCMWDENSLSYRVDTDLLRCDISGVDCGIPERLPGSLPYTITSTAYSAQFTFNCRSPLFKRVGSSGIGNIPEIVTCGADSLWDFGDLRCEGPTCEDPGTIAGTTQVATTYEEFAVVRYTCTRAGFSLNNSRPLFCEYDPVTGALAWNGTAPSCTDTQTPTFANCPSSVRMVDYLSSALFAEPQASDNVMVKEVTIQPFNFRVTDIIQNDFQVSYVARDHAGNIGSCTVGIRVRDMSPPQIRCRSSFEEQLFSETQIATYDPLNFVLSQADNSGIVALTFSINMVMIDRTDIGNTLTVKIDASDPTGNADFCLVQIKVTAPKCFPWSLNVKNGTVTCFQQSGAGYRCDARCDAGFRFSESPYVDTISISCSANSDWDRSTPVCVAAYYTNYRQSFQMKYRTRETPSLSCENSYANQLTGHLSDLTAALTSLCGSISPAVTVSAAANIIPIAVTGYSEGVYATFHLDLDSTSESSINQCASLVTTEFQSVRSSLQNIRTLGAQAGCAASEVVQFDGSLHNGVNCQNNQESKVEPSTGKFLCVACAPGYASTLGSACAACREGSYFDSTARSCQFCPSGTRSQQLAARNVDDCYLHCPYGYVSSTGLAPCSPCPEHTYSLNRTYCAACSRGLFTRGDAQGYPNSCRAACEAGTFSYDGLQPCTPCPKGFFQTQKGTSNCTECSDDMTTLSVNSTSPSQCVFADPIVCQPNPCSNGTCTVENHEFRCSCPVGYTGRQCETRIRPCDSNPCYNGGFCLNNGTDYQCVCKATTSGRNCEIDIEDDCAYSPCHNFGACQDLVGNHICLCPSFSNYTYTFGLPGSDCTQLRDTCQENQCYNGATCDNRGSIRRKCFCPDGYHGEACERDKDYCATTNPCQNGAQCRDGSGSGVTCNCLPGYSGDRCEVRLDRCATNSCGLFSTCVDVYTTSQVQCYCNQGFSNVNGSCQAIVIDACQSSPCENNGNCVRSGNSYECRCQAGYEGANCQHNIDDCITRPCQNGGQCRDQLNGFQCDCPSDTVAPVCTDGFDQCSVGNNPCNVYGTQSCVDYYRSYQCICLPGYFGVNCTEGQTNCASFPCRHGGTCTDSGNSYFCQCPDGYEGPHCEIVKNFCANQPCFNGGTCVNTDTGTVCNCPAGYRGDRCEIRYDLCTVANPCRVAGSSCITNANNQPSCNCPNGYTGPYCQSNSGQCTATTCLNGGTCNDASASVLCSCPAGYSGSVCEVNNDDCIGVTCPGNSVCVDGFNSYTCVCTDNKIGDNCDKDLSLNFDLVLEPQASYLTPDLATWPLSSQAFTVATWVRFTRRNDPGTVLALYGLNSASTVTNPQHLVRIELSSATLEFAGTRTLAISPPIDDGFWHHVALTWDGSSGQATLYVDKTVSASTTAYGFNVRLTPYGWLVLGGIYDSVTNSVDRTQGMAGRLSRVHVLTSALDARNITALYNNNNYKPAGSLLTLTKHLLNGSSAIVDYNSQLSKGVCLSAANCQPITQVADRPKVVRCPEDQTVVSERTSTPVWDTATFLQNLPVQTNYASGSTQMGWGYYGVAYTQSDSDGDTAVCTFLLHNRRGSCKIPEPPIYGSQSCVTTTAGIRCSVTCDVNYVRSSKQPLFLTCGSYGMYDTSDRILPYVNPSCTTCETPYMDITMNLNYTLTSNAVCVTVTNQLPSNIRATLNTLNAAWNQRLCGASCDSVSVSVDCESASAKEARATFTLLSLDELIPDTANSMLRSVKEVLSVAVVDDGSFTYSAMVPEVMSLEISSRQVCSGGKVLLNGCCIDCGLGHYYSNDLGTCAQCSRGTYLDQLGQQGSSLSTPCVACPSGKTTANAASQSISDCNESCTYGSYFNLTTSQCQLCPLGFYAENPESYYCDGCPHGETTAREGSTASVSCSINPVTTPAPIPTSTDDPNTGASTTGTEMSWPEILLLVLGIILIIVIILVILFFCCRQHLVKWCPCLVTKVKPQDKTGWHYVDRFGETRMKFASYNLSEMRGRNSDRELLEDSVEEGSVHTNISLQVPVFEEKLNGTVKKKSVHMSEHQSEKKRDKRRKKKRSRKTADLNTTPDPEQAVRAHMSAAAPSATELPSDGTVRRPLSAFNQPRPTLEEVPYENFVSARVYENVDSVSDAPRTPSSGRRTARIMIDSDDDDR